MNNKGRYWEICASRYLAKKRYKLVDVNFTSFFGEIDLIVKNDKYICFVEVKQRDKNSIAMPREFVDERKQKKIIKTAEYYLAYHQTKLQPRFDIIEIYTDNKKIKSIKHLENAYGIY